MQLNETVRAYDLAEALRGETGKFEVVTSQGSRMMVTSTPGHTIANLRITSERGSEQMLWIKKIADFQSETAPQFRSQSVSH